MLAKVFLIQYYYQLSPLFQSLNLKENLSCLQREDSSQTFYLCVNYFSKFMRSIID